MEDLVSIYISSYNHEMFIKDCLESIISQTYTNIELLITDDCSTDSTYSIIKKMEPELKKRFSRVLINKNLKNMGLCYTMNRLIENCRGALLIGIGSDDALLSEGISNYVSYMESHPKCNVFQGNPMEINEMDHYPFRGIYEGMYKTNPIDPQRKILDQIYDGTCGIAAPAVMMRSCVFKNYGLHDENFIAEDWEYWCRISRFEQFYYSDIKGVLYRERPNSLSHFKVITKSSEADRLRVRNMWNDDRAVLDRYREYVDKSVLRNGCRIIRARMDMVIVAEDSNLLYSIIRYASKYGYKYSYKNVIILLIMKIKSILNKDTNDKV